MATEAANQLLEVSEISQWEVFTVLTGHPVFHTYLINFFVPSQGIEIITQTQQKTPELKRELSNGFCACAELYMTDLCDEKGAQEECESAIGRAVGSDEGNPEAWQTKARLALITEHFEVRRTEREGTFHH